MSKDTSRLQLAHNVVIGPVDMAHYVAQGARGTVIEVDVESCGKALNDVGDVGLAKKFVHALHQQGAQPLEVRIGLLTLQNFERREARDDRSDIAVECPAMHRQRSLSRHPWVAQEVHDTRSPDHTRDRKASTKGLSKGGHIWTHTVMPLRSGEADTKAGDDFVEDEEATVAIAGISDSGKIACFRLDHCRVAHHRFHDYPSDFSGVISQERLQGGGVVPRKENDVLISTWHLTSRLRPFRVLLWITATVVARVGADEYPVLPAMVVALELDDERAACCSSGQAKSEGNGFCAGHQEAHSFGTRDDVADQFSQ